MPPSPPAAERTDGASVPIGALVPLTRPGWVEAGRHLLAGLELAVRDVNEGGGIRADRSSWWSGTPRPTRGGSGGRR